MKSKIVNLAMILVLTNVMVFGFFFMYALLWISLGLPHDSWVVAVWAILTILSVGGFFWWVCRGDKEVEESVTSIAYVCDEKACEECYDGEHRYCYHTCDIRHAKNFMEVEPGKFIETYLIPPLKVNEEARDE